MGIIDEGAAPPTRITGLANDVPVEFFLARHGQTEWNVRGRRQGQLDSPLTPDGVAQAHHIGELLADQRIDSVFASPLGRALTTATICATRLRVPVITMPTLAEIDHGAWAGLTDPQIAEEYPEQYGHRNTDKYHFQFPGGESYANADQRALAALVAIADRHVRRPLVVSHEMIGRLLRRHLLGLTPSEALAWNHPHGVVFRIRYHEAKTTPTDEPQATRETEPDPATTTRSPAR
jgi:probable phosphoglycerate mutase